MKIKIGDLVRVKSCYVFPELKGQFGIFVGMESVFNNHCQATFHYYKVMVGNKTVKIIDNDLEVINESKNNET